MKKKFLVVLLALTMVFAFSVAALADDVIKTPDPTTTIEITVGDSTATLSNGNATVYPTNGATSASVTVTDRNATNTITGHINYDSGNSTINSSGYSKVSGNITYDITSGDPGETKSYKIDFTLEVYNGNSDNNLQSVTLINAVGGDAMEKVEVSGTTLTGHVDQNVSKVTVRVTAASNTQVTINGNTASSQEITLSNKATAFDIVVTAANGQSKPYKMTIIKDYDDTSLTINGEDPDRRGDFTFIYPFDTKKSDTLEFTPVFAGEIDIDNDEDDINVRYRNGKIVVDFDTAPKGDYSFDITITALNGDDETYGFYLEQGEAVQLDNMDIMIGDDNTRNDLDFTMYPNRFDEDVYDYYVFVPWDKEYKNDVDVFINAEFDSKDYTVKCGSKSMKDDDFINVGSVADGDKETFTLTVTNDDTKETSEYTVTVYYGAEKADDTATLRDLDARYGSSFRTAATISPSFSSSVYNYIVSVPAKTDEVRLELRASDSDAIILCNDVEVDGRYITLSDLKSGENKFQVVVVAEDRDTTRTYNITVNVGATGLLSNLTFSTNAGSFNFSPVFASGTYNYVANVPNSVTTLYVTPTAVDSGYSISITNLNKSAAQSVISGRTSTGIALNEGLNEIRITVYSSSSNFKNYTLNIYRQPANPNYQVSVQNLYVNGTAKTLNAVNIKGNNFLKLRDLAYLLDGTSKQFNVTYTESINTAHIHSLTSYVNDPQNPVNQPITLSRPQLSSQKVTLDGSNAYPIAYNVAGSNYVNLRQVCAMLDIGLTYSAATNTVTITTANSYTPGL